VIKPTGNAS